MSLAQAALGKLGIAASPNPMWQIGIPILFLVLMGVFFSMGFWYKNQYGRYRSTPNSIEQLLTVRRHTLGQAIDPLVSSTKSVCSQFVSKTPPYNTVSELENAIVNWRPLTVRMAGYLGGDTSVINGVFDMVKGVQLALHLGARAFVFDIDYLDSTPCNPVLIHRDSKGVMRSLHTGDIKTGMKALKDKAFVTNYDPVLVIVYLRRIPPGKTQQSAYFKSIAASLDPLSTYHLGSTEQGNFHNCRSEGNLFTSGITNFQKKFIVLCNYNTNLLPSTPNPKDNLDFWTNARLYLDPSGPSSSLGDVTDSVPNGQVAYAKVGATSQLLALPTTNIKAYLDTTSSTFTMALGSMEDTFTPTQLSMLLNTLGIHSIPIDVVRLGETAEHVKTLTNPTPPVDMIALSNATNPTDPLSFWTHGGWSRKNIIQGFENPSQEPAKVPVSAPIPGFVIPKTVKPKKPPPSTNSNGGLVNIS